MTAIHASVSAAAAATSLQNIDLSTRTDSPVSAASLLPPPISVGDGDGAIAELAMLLTKADEQDRSSERQIEDASDRAAAQEDAERVDELRQKAQDEESGALASGIAGIVGGVCGGAAAFFSPAGSPGVSGSNGASVSAAASAGWGSFLSGMGKVAPGTGDIVSGVFKGDAVRDEAAADLAEAQSQSQVRLANQAHEDNQAANASMDKVEQFLDQLQQSRSATRLAAASVRG